MTKSRGYAYNFVQDVFSANQQLIGVRLGVTCIENHVPVRDVAEVCGVSRQTVYWWFTGRFHPRPSQTEKIDALITKYRD